MQGAWLATAVAGALLGAGPTAPGQLAQTPSARSADEVEAVVVTARRTGVPVWLVSRGRSTVILIGYIDRVPRGAAWSPAALDEAVGLADTIILPARNRGSLADITRAVYRARSAVLLPRGKTLTDYITPELGSRLGALQGAGALRENYLKRHPSSVALELRTHIGANDRGGVDAVDVVLDAASKRKKVTDRITVLGADKLLDTFLERGPAGSVPCLEASVSAAEAGKPEVRTRVENWTKSRAAQVMASPVQKAIEACTLGRTPELERLLRAQWREVVQRKLNEPGVTLGVAPLEYLAEQEGVLDALAADGMDVQGPRWRAN